MLDGHFVLNSGLHSGQYINKDRSYPDTLVLQGLCEQIGREATLLNLKPEVVVGPEKGGILLASWTAWDLTHRIRMFDNAGRVLAVYAEKDGSGFVLKRGYGQDVKGKRCLLVEDIITTGRSVRLAAEAIRACGGNVVAVGALVNRGGVTAEMIGVPTLYALANPTLETYPAEDCPLCRDGVPVNTDFGHGAAFLAKKIGG